MSLVFLIEESNTKCFNFWLQTARGGEAERKLLTDVWGEVPQNNTTAIMGPSGAGYVTLSWNKIVRTTFSRIMTIALVLDLGTKFSSLLPLFMQKDFPFEHSCG